ncbi:uncharacterized protein CDV56_102119 [Aspergillus thermomutatus]|uniref:Lysine-specific metallo-endopeptidase domain-containing protein n=1 Tax=Aspergillus thermomutatus TaxID=41047 RepID=A0A397G5A4_ASPTH|nr:uncharacterized protein CDV56_102119 [Aspergillus thermomutatus]RHZ45034.1 hypothetical protein CDV56_102119 [Aspergillus thermomutatus]
MLRLPLLLLYASSLWNCAIAVDVPTEVAVTLTTSELFDLGDGSCDKAGRISTIDAHLAECVKLINAALTAYHNWQDDAAYRKMFATWLSMEFDEFEDPVEVDEFFTDRWSTIETRLAGVALFLSGGGLVNAKSSDKPSLFCSDDFAVQKTWETTARDGSGEEMVRKRDDEGNIVETYTIADVYPKIKLLQETGEIDEDEDASKIMPYWVDYLKGYDFSAVGTEKICTKDALYGWTSRADDSPSTEAGNLDGFTFASFNRHILLCPLTFSPPSQYHGTATLAELVTSAVYPVANARILPEAYSTISCTLYHELFHLVDSAGTDSDSGLYGSLIILDASFTAKKASVVNAPEPYVFFSLASYLYQNAPSGSSAVAFIPPNGWQTL